MHSICTYKSSCFVLKANFITEFCCLSEGRDSSVSIVTRLGRSSIVGTHRKFGGGGAQGACNSIATGSSCSGIRRP
jgi:hypothetical protein